MRTIWRGILAAGATVLVVGCSSTPTAEQEAAAVEDRKPDATTAKPGADTQPIGQKPVTGVDLTSKKPATGFAVLKDPNNILSKRSVYFDYDSFTVKDEFKSLVEAHARFLRDNPTAKMLIQGNTDERGSREYNLALGQKRADALRKMLTLLGAKDEQIEAVSLGEEKPKAQGADEQSYAQNRRDDMLYSGEF